MDAEACCWRSMPAPRLHDVQICGGWLWGCPVGKAPFNGAEAAPTVALIGVPLQHHHNGTVPFARLTLLLASSHRVLSPLTAALPCHTFCVAGPEWAGQVQAADAPGQGTDRLHAVQDTAGGAGGEAVQR